MRSEVEQRSHSGKFESAQKLAVPIILILSVLQFGGCATRNSQTNNSKQYVVTARFYRPQDTLIGEIEVGTKLNVPFAVEVQDANTNHYRLGGTLRRKSEKVFLLEKMELAYPSGSAGPGNLELTLGHEDMTWMDDLVVVGGFGVEVKEGWPASSTSNVGTGNPAASWRNPVPPDYGALLTDYCFPTTNTIVGPTIPTGAPIYVSVLSGVNAGPIAPANVTVGPANTYLNPVGICRPLSGFNGQPVTAPVSSPSAKEWPMYRGLPICFPCSFANTETIYTKDTDGSYTNLGTISRMIIISAPSYPSTNCDVTIRAL